MSRETAAYGGFQRYYAYVMGLAWFWFWFWHWPFNDYSPKIRYIKCLNSSNSVSYLANLCKFDRKRLADKHVIVNGNIFVGFLHST